jgi:hypothetical protein
VCVELNGGCLNRHWKRVSKVAEQLVNGTAHRLDRVLKKLILPPYNHIPEMVFLESGEAIESDRGTRLKKLNY